MANPNPSPNTRFRRGNLAAQGRGQQQKALAAVRKMTNEELVETCELILNANRMELQAVLDDPTTPMLKVNLISAIMADTSKGLTYTVDKLLERIVGRPKERIELSGDPDNPMAFQAVQVVISLPSNGREGEEVIDHAKVNET